MEVESPQGAKLRLELKAIGTSALAERLIRAFAGVVSHAADDAADADSSGGGGC